MRNACWNYLPCRNLQDEERQCPTRDIYSNSPECEFEPWGLGTKDTAVEKENGPLHEEVDPGIC